MTLNFFLQEKLNSFRNIVFLAQVFPLCPRISIFYFIPFFPHHHIFQSLINRKTLLLIIWVFHMQITSSNCPENLTETMKFQGKTSENSLVERHFKYKNSSIILDRVTQRCFFSSSTCMKTRAKNTVFHLTIGIH